MVSREPELSGISKHPAVRLRKWVPRVRGTMYMGAVHLSDGQSCSAPIPTPRAEGTSLKNAAWVDLIDPSEAERSAFEQAFGLRVPTKEQIVEIETTSRAAHRERCALPDRTADLCRRQRGLDCGADRICARQKSSADGSFRKICGVRRRDRRIGRKRAMFAGLGVRADSSKSWSTAWPICSKPAATISTTRRM